MSRGPDAATRLERALLESARAAGCPLALRKSDMKRWASATFTGARHLLVLAGEAAAALDNWISALPEAEFALGHHLVADMVVQSVSRDGDEVTIALEVLTVEER